MTTWKNRPLKNTSFPLHLSHPQPCPVRAEESPVPSSFTPILRRPCQGPQTTPLAGPNVQQTKKKKDVSWKEISVCFGRLYGFTERLSSWTSQAQTVRLWKTLGWQKILRLLESDHSVVLSALSGLASWGWWGGLENEATDLPGTWPLNQRMAPQGPHVSSSWLSLQGLAQVRQSVSICWLGGRINIWISSSLGLGLKAEKGQKYGEQERKLQNVD